MNWLSSQALAEHQAKISATLDHLTDFLDNPSAKKTLNDLGLWSWNGGVKLNLADLPRSQELYRRVYLWRIESRESLHKPIIQAANTASQT